MHFSLANGENNIVAWFVPPDIQPEKGAKHCILEIIVMTAKYTFMKISVVRLPAQIFQVHSPLLKSFLRKMFHPDEI